MPREGSQKGSLFIEGLGRDLKTNWQLFGSETFTSTAGNTTLSKLREEMCQAEGSAGHLEELSEALSI